jgi:hypothetical protein
MSARLHLALFSVAVRAEMLPGSLETRRAASPNAKKYYDVRRPSVGDWDTKVLLTSTDLLSQTSDFADFFEEKKPLLACRHQYRCLQNRTRDIHGRRDQRKRLEEFADPSFKLAVKKGHRTRTSTLLIF